MALVITDNCIECGACTASCPADAIVESADIPVIDQSACVECGSCIMVCPIMAIEEK